MLFAKRVSGQRDLFNQEDEVMLKQYVAIQVFLATRKKSKGQSLAEYGLVLALIAVVCITALTTLGSNINQMLTGLASKISGASSTAGLGS